MALQTGDAPTARRYAEALVARDPADLNANLILARAARDMGDIPLPARRPGPHGNWQIRTQSDIRRR
ncbi:hypothetical protein [Sulfitobacter sediminilitoris]|uniref:hypothetical protein n=1 Tax=Sulfitobacter sediminilitoris TaxID=2698830 RepID=UPI003615D490